jgi:hypothetical protein
VFLGEGKSPADKERLKVLREAEKQYLASLKEREKRVHQAEKEYSKRISKAEGELQRVKNPPPLGKYGSVTAREDRIETPSGTMSLFEGPVRADVQATGNVVVQKDKKTDTRELYLKITGPGLTHLEKCNPDDGEKVRQLAVKIENASRSAEKQRALREEGIARAERDLKESREDRSGIATAERELAELRSQKPAMDARRAEAGLPPLAEEYYTPGRRRKRRLLIAAAAVLLVIALIGAIAALGGGDESSQPGEPPVVNEEAPAEEPPAEPEDTGRMSEGEFGLFEQYHQEVVDESLQWSDEYATCATIGQTGDLAGFRDCIEEAWDGFEDAALLAYSNAEDTLNDVGRECLESLRAYRLTVRRLYSQNAAAYETAKALNFDLIPAAFRPLPKVARRFSSVSTDTLAACSPS